MDAFAIFEMAAAETRQTTPPLVKSHTPLSLTVVPLPVPGDQPPQRALVCLGLKP